LFFAFFVDPVKNYAILLYLKILLKRFAPVRNCYVAGYVQDVSNGVDAKKNYCIISNACVAKRVRIKLAQFQARVIYFLLCW